MASRLQRNWHADRKARVWLVLFLSVCVAPALQSLSHVQPTPQIATLVYYRVFFFFLRREHAFLVAK